MNNSEFNKEIVSAMDSKCKGSIAEATTNYNLMMFALIVALFGIGYMFYCHVMSMYDGRQRELQTTVNELVAEIRGQPYSNRRDHNIQEATDDNQILEPLIDVLPNVIYDSGTHSSRLNNFNPTLLLEFIRNHQFWLYEGSEAYEPFRETVQWLVSRSVLSISPQQLGKLRVLRKTPQGSDLSQPLLSTRALQPLNDRVVRPEDPSLTFEHFYQSGKNEYTTGNWADCVAFMLKAIEDFLFYRQEVLWCRRQVVCSMCRGRYGADLTNFEQLVEELDRTLLFMQYESNQALCLLKQLGDLKQAVKSAFTFLVANPGDEDTLNNLHFYMEQPEFEREMLIDEWQYRHEMLYMKAVNAYSNQEWLNCVNLFQESLQQFWEALEDCRSECEYLNNNEEVNGGDEQNEWSVFITETYLSILQCKHACVSQQSFLNGRFTKHLLLSHYEYLHVCQFNLKNGREACQSVENALLLQPKNIVMRRNKLFYLNYFNGNVENDVSLFQPSKEIKNFVRREKMERQFLQFLEKEMNEEYVAYFTIIRMFIFTISQLYEMEENPLFEGIYCVSKGLFGKSNCERPTISVSINNFNCGQMGGEEFTGCVIVFCEV
uniref:Alpha-carbonic anhydrase domain-containing protein n=1 Tax=Meloidogyne javanica TaxID=6303 RepID=A0A915LML1_MELJA